MRAAYSNNTDNSSNIGSSHSRDAAFTPHSAYSGHTSVQITDMRFNINSSRPSTGQDVSGTDSSNESSSSSNVSVTGNTYTGDYSNTASQRARFGSNFVPSVTGAAPTATAMTTTTTTTAAAATASTAVAAASATTAPQGVAASAVAAAVATWPHGDKSAVARSSDAVVVGGKRPQISKLSPNFRLSTFGKVPRDNEALVSAMDGRGSGARGSPVNVHAARAAQYQGADGGGSSSTNSPVAGASMQQQRQPTGPLGSPAQVPVPSPSAAPLPARPPGTESSGPGRPLKLRRNPLPHQQSVVGNSVPQTVTATKVDPPLGNSGASSTQTAARPSLVASDRGRVGHASSNDLDRLQYQYQQQQQQQPCSLRLDAKPITGFYSEPASGAGSPVNIAPGIRTYPGRIGSVDTSAAPGAPAAAALGVFFSASPKQRDGGSNIGSSTGVGVGVGGGGNHSYGYSNGANRRMPPTLRVETAAAASSNAHNSHFHSQNTELPSAPSPRTQESAGTGANTGAGAADYSGGGQAGTSASHSQLSVVPEGGIIGSSNPNNQHMPQYADEFPPHPSSPNAPSFSAASSSFSFRNSQRSQSQQHIYLQQQNSNRSSTVNSSSTNNRESMFGRLKEKMKYLKPRSRPHSDNITDRRSALSAHGFSSQQQQQGPVSSSPFLNKAYSTSNTVSEATLFGIPLARATQVAGMRVGVFAGSDEPCVVPTVVAVCGRHLREHGQQTQGIFRVNGSMKRVQKLQDQFNEPPTYGRHIEWTGYTLHDAATLLRRYLISLPEPVISIEYYDAFRDKLEDSVSAREKALAYGLLISQLSQESRHTLLYVLELLSLFAKPENAAHTLMNSSNLAAVLQPCLLVHPGHVADPHEYSRLKAVVEFLIVHASEIRPQAASTASHSQSGGGSVSRGVVPDRAHCGDEYVVVGRDEGSSSSYSEGGAGLIVFDPDDANSADGERSKFVPSDDGTTVAASLNNPSAQQSHWSSSYVRESELAAGGMGTTTGSAIHLSNAEEPAFEQSRNLPAAALPVSQQQQQQQQQYLSMSRADAMSGRPPRAESLGTANTPRSTPVMGTAGFARVQQTLPLGSVTARLYDPSSPGNGSSTLAEQPSTGAVDAAGGGNGRVANQGSESQLASQPQNAGADTPSYLGPHQAASPFLARPSSPQSKRSSLVLSHIQYQHTAQQGVSRKTEGLASQGSPQRRDLGADSPRPRRSRSFVLSSPKSRDDMRTVFKAQGDGCRPNSGMLANSSADELARGLAGSTAHAVYARRGVGERRAGQVAVRPSANRPEMPPGPPAGGDTTAYSLQQRKQHPLPPAPSAAPGDSVHSAPEHRFQGPANHGSGVSSISSSYGRSALTAANGVFQLYPRSTSKSPPVKLGVDALSPPNAKRSPGPGSTNAGGAAAQYQYQDSLSAKYGSPGQPPRGPRAMMSPDMAAGGSGSGGAARASWLSDLTDDEHDRLTGVHGQHAVSLAVAGSPRVAHRQGMASSAGFTEAQQQKLHPIVQADPMPLHAPVSQKSKLNAGVLGLQAANSESQKRGKPQKDQPPSEGTKEKTSKSRLKNIFRIGHGHSSSSNNSSGGSDKSSGSKGQKGSAQAPAAVMRIPTVLTDRSVLKTQSTPSSSVLASASSQRSDSASGHGSYSGNHNSGSRSAGVSVPRDLDGSFREQIAGNAVDSASRIHVAVPAGHLSIVYPDSPMSKADTLRKSSRDSVASTRMSNSRVPSSGHAQLVNPDRQAREQYQLKYVAPEYSDARTSMSQPEASSNAGEAPAVYQPSTHRSDLHAVPSASTTLHSTGQRQNQQQQQQIGSAGGSIGAGKFGSVDGSSRSHDGSRRLEQRQQQQQLPRAPFHPQYPNHDYSSLSQTPPSSVPSRSTAVGRDASSGVYSSPFMLPNSRGSYTTVSGSGDNVFGASDSNVKRMYAMHRLAGSDTRISERLSHRRYGVDDASEDDDAYILPRISNGSPLMMGFDFDGRMSLQQQQYQQARTRQMNRLSTATDSRDEDPLEAGSRNAPRRSRSLRNTITSLRRRLSKSSKSGGGGPAGTGGSSDGMAPGAEDMAATSSAY